MRPDAAGLATQFGKACRCHITPAAVGPIVIIIHSPSRSSSRIRLLNDSTYPFSHGLPGSINSVSAPSGQYQAKCRVSLRGAKRQSNLNLAKASDCREPPSAALAMTTRQMKCYRILGPALTAGTILGPASSNPVTFGIHYREPFRCLLLALFHSLTSRRTILPAIRSKEGESPLRRQIA